MNRWSNKIILVFVLLGCSSFKPFFSFGQFIQKDIVGVQELLDHVKSTENIDVAYDPLSIIGVLPSQPCPSHHSIMTCLIENLHGQFEFIKVSDNKYLMRKIDALHTEMIHGTVWDETNDQPLAFAEIISTSDNQFVVSDEQGKFSLHPTLSGNITVNIQYLGYQPQKVMLTNDVESNKIKLTSEPIIIATTNVVSSLPIMTSGTRGGELAMSADAASRMPGNLAGDILRGIQIQPGVSSTNDVSSELNIRGGNANQNLVLLDNIPIYQTGHFYNLFSILNDDPIDKVTLYKNYFPAHSGDATTGILQMEIKNPLNEKTTLHADVNWLTSDMYAAGIIKDKIGISISARTTNGNVARGAFKKVYSNDQDQLIVQTQNDIEVFRSESSPDVLFNDLIGSLHWKIGASTSVSGRYIFAADDVSIKNVYSIESRNGREPLEYGHESQQNWKNKGGGISLEHTWKKALTMTVDAYTSHFDRQDDTYTSLSGGQQSQEQRATDHLRFSMQDGIKDNSGRVAFNWLTPRYSTWNVGYQFQQLSTYVNVFRTENHTSTRNISSNIHTLFVSNDYRLNDLWNMTTGLRTSYNSLHTKIYFSPRMKMVFKPSDVLSIKSSAGLYNQYLRSITLLNANNANKSIWALSNDANIPILTSKMVMLGGIWVSNFVTIDAELYYRFEDGVVQELISTDDIPVSSMLSFAQVGLFSGQGRRYGMDLMIRHSGKKLQSVMTYSLSKGEVSFKTFQNGNWIAAANDRRHEVNWYNNVTWGRFDVHVNTVYASGNPHYAYTVERDSKYTIGYKALDSYARYDVGTDFNFLIGKHKARIGFNVFNLFDHRNKSSVRYARLKELQDQARTSLFTESIDLLGRTANVSFQIHLE